MAELPDLPASDGPVAGMLVSEGICPWCGSDLEPRSNNDGPPIYGWCSWDEMGWSLTLGVAGAEPTAWWAEDCVPGGPISEDDRAGRYA